MGGTTLPADASGNPNRALEYAWNLGGGGISTAEAEPAYQLGVQSTGFRTGPDLAYDADIQPRASRSMTRSAPMPFSGRARGSRSAAPAWAPRKSPRWSQSPTSCAWRPTRPRSTVPANCCPPFTRLPPTDPQAFQDITSGNNGYAAGPGYDFATGFGTPNAQYLVPDLVAAYAKPAATQDALLDRRRGHQLGHARQLVHRRSCRQECPAVRAAGSGRPMSSWT